MLYIQWLQKPFRPLNFLHTSLFCRFKMDKINIFVIFCHQSTINFSSIYNQLPIMTKWKHVIRKISKFIKNLKLKSLIYIILCKSQLQLPVFLGTVSLSTDVLSGLSQGFGWPTQGVRNLEAVRKNPGCSSISQLLRLLCSWERLKLYKWFIPLSWSMPCCNFFSLDAMAWFCSDMHCELWDRIYTGVCLSKVCPINKICHRCNPIKF